MPSPLDELSFAELVAAMQGLVAEQQAAIRHLLVQELTGPGPFLLTASAHGGKELLVSNGGSSTTVEVHLPADAAVGTLHVIRRYGVAPVKAVAQTGAVLRTARAGHNSPALQYSAMVLRCLRNAGGSAAEWIVDGDTAAIL